MEKVNEKYMELRNQTKNDLSPLNKSNLANEFNISGLNGKWISYLADWKRAFLIIEQKRKKLYRELFEYYKIDYKLKLDSKEQFQLFIETDEKYIYILEKSQMIRAILELIEKTLEKLSNKQWEVKNFCEYLKWSEGLN